MERTLALLAFDNPEESPFGDLLNMMQRQKVCVFICVGHNHHNGLVSFISMTVYSPIVGGITVPGVNSGLVPPSLMLGSVSLYRCGAR